MGGPLVVEAQHPHGGYRLGSGLAPAHARSLFKRGNEVLTGTLHYAGADIPARRAIAVVGHARGLIGEVGHPLIAHGSHLAASGQRPPFVRQGRHLPLRHAAQLLLDAMKPARIEPASR